MNLKAIFDSKLSVTSAKTYQDLLDLFMGQYEDKEPGKEPSETGAVVIDYETGEELGFTVTNWGWESKELPKYMKAAKRIGLVYSMSDMGDLTILSPSVGKWMDKYSKIFSDISDKIYAGKKSRVKVKKEDFEKFIRWSKLTGYGDYHDYDYSDIKEYVTDSSTKESTNRAIAEKVINNITDLPFGPAAAYPDMVENLNISFHNNRDKYPQCEVIVQDKDQVEREHYVYKEQGNYQEPLKKFIVKMLNKYN